LLNFPLCTRNASLLEPPPMSPLRLTARASLKVPPSVPRSVMLPTIQLNGSAGWVTHVCLGGHPVVETVCARYERPTASPVTLIPKPGLTP